MALKTSGLGLGLGLGLVLHGLGLGLGLGLDTVGLVNITEEQSIRLGRWRHSPILSSVLRRWSL